MGVYGTSQLENDIVMLCGDYESITLETILTFLLFLGRFITLKFLIVPDFYWQTKAVGMGSKDQYGLNLKDE